MKTGLVMEGGAMRGLFTAGILDIFMENGVTFDGAVGVSAGAVFGINLKSHQPGRVVRYNKTYCQDKRYAGISSLLHTGDLYNTQFNLEVIPQQLDPFDFEVYKKNPMEFYVVATDVDTGKPVYHLCPTAEGEDVQWMRASASMPGVSRIVTCGGLRLSDGGTADSIPLRFLESMGLSQKRSHSDPASGFCQKALCPSQNAGRRSPGLSPVASCHGHPSQNVQHRTSICCQAGTLRQLSGSAPTGSTEHSLDLPGTGGTGTGVPDRPQSRFRAAGRDQAFS